MKTLFRIAALTAVLASSTAAIAADTSSDVKAVNGRWDAVLTRDGTEIPFRLDIKGAGANLQGVLYDGFRPYDGTTNATFKDGKLVLNIEHYLTTINASLKDGKLAGTVVAQNRESSAQYGFQAVRHVDTAAATDAPSIAGTWVIPLDTPSSKGEKAFRLIVQQQGAEVAASILRIDGDTGSYSGSYKDGKWVLSHFDGGRPGVITVTPAQDGTLKVVQEFARPAKAGQETAATDNAYGSEATPDGRYASVLTAYRQEVAQAKG